MSFKVSLFNPFTAKIRRFRYDFEWDAINHCWWQNGHRYIGSPAEAVRHMAEALCREGEYISIKQK